MIIQCPRCAGRYSIGDEIGGKAGARFRCTRCGHVFSRQDALRDDESRPEFPPREAPIPQEEDFKHIAGLLDDITRGDAAAQADGNEETPAGDRGFPDENGGGDENLSEDRGLKGRGWMILLVFCLIVVLATAVFWQSSPARSAFTSRFSGILSSLEGLVGSRTKTDSKALIRRNIELVDVRESVHNNWITGKILLVEGIALNKNDVSLSSIRVRGKLLDAARNVIAETESFCGNLLSEEELRNLTKKEIERELLVPSGRDRRGLTIPPGGPAPFMLAFVNPVQGAGLFVVELVDVTPLRPEDNR